MAAMRQVMGIAVAAVVLGSGWVGFGQTAAMGAGQAPASVATVRYVDGWVMLNGHPLVPGESATEIVKPGEFVQTGDGKVEIQLIPGVRLRLDDRSAAMMVTTDAKRIEVEVERGRAQVEVDRIEKENYILIDQKDGGTQLLKPGLYEFDANKNMMRVFEGEAAVFGGTGSAAVVGERSVTVKEGREIAVTTTLGKAVEFDRDTVVAKDGLYQWGGERAQESGGEGGGGADYAGSGEPGYSPNVYPYYTYGWPGYGFYPYGYGYGYYGPVVYSGFGFGYGGFYGRGFGGGFHGGGRR